MLNALLLLLCSSAFAQAPTLDLSSLLNTAATEVAAPGPTSASMRYASADVNLVRWAGQAASSGALKKGDMVEIVARGDGGLVRVRRGTDFGWVAEATLSVTPVEAAPAPEADEGESTEPTN